VNRCNRHVFNQFGCEELLIAEGSEPDIQAPFRHSQSRLRQRPRGETRIEHSDKLPERTPTGALAAISSINNGLEGGHERAVASVNVCHSDIWLPANEGQELPFWRASATDTHLRTGRAAAH
jgi:hypothetical protein